MRITSPAFGNAAPIPLAHSIDGAGTLPPLQFHDVPAGTVSLALVSHDPDVPRDRRPDGNFDHWVVWDLPPGCGGISDESDHRGRVGVNTRGENTWVPCAPPPGSGIHRYFFTLYALDAMLGLPPTAGRPEVEAAMVGHVLDSAQLMGTYER